MSQGFCGEVPELPSPGHLLPIHNSCENWTAARATSLRYPRMIAIIKEYVGLAALSAFVSDFMNVLF